MLVTFYIQGVLKLKKYNSGAKRLKQKCKNVSRPSPNSLQYQISPGFGGKQTQSFDTACLLHKWSCCTSFVQQFEIKPACCCYSGGKKLVCSCYTGKKLTRRFSGNKTSVLLLLWKENYFEAVIQQIKLTFSCYSTNKTSVWLLFRNQN